MKNKQFLAFLGCVLFVLFLLFSFLVKKDLFTNIDFTITVRLQDKIPRFLDNFFGLFSFLARIQVLTIVLGLVLLVRKKISGIFIFALFVFGHLVVLAGKELLHHPGPLALFYRQDSLPMFRDYVVPGSSYPSGHSLRAFFLAVLFGYMVFTSKRIATSQKVIYILFLFGFAACVAAAKVVLGQHWTTDVVGGTMLGISLGLISLLFLSSATKVEEAK